LLPWPSAIWLASFCIEHRHFVPRARAAAKPTLVRSETNSHSNSASAAKMSNASFPSGVVVLIELQILSLKTYLRLGLKLQIVLIL
jgi:hypothetical protein